MTTVLECRCKRCGVLSVGVIAACACALTQQHEFCSEAPSRAPFGTICNGAAWEPVHGEHHNPQPARAPQLTAATSTSATLTSTSIDPIIYRIRSEERRV